MWNFQDSEKISWNINITERVWQINELKSDLNLFSALIEDQPEFTDFIENITVPAGR
jgi:hypothetical protein